MIQEVILVDTKDNPIGTMEKMEAHRQGKLHRAFSIFIFDSKGSMLLQQRALNKYHSGGLWTNACCSHPMPGESTHDAALRRLNEELGFTTNLSLLFQFIYEAKFDNGLIEHEFDHVYFGIYEDAIRVNKDEVMNYEYRPMKEIKAEIHGHPEKFTAWFRIAFPKLENWLKTTPFKLH